MESKFPNFVRGLSGCISDLSPHAPIALQGYSCDTMRERDLNIGGCLRNAVAKVTCKVVNTTRSRLWNANRIVRYAGLVTLENLFAKRLVH